MGIKLLKYKNPGKKPKKQRDTFIETKNWDCFSRLQLLMDRTVIQNLYFVLKATGWKDKIKIKNKIIGNEDNLLPRNSY